MGGFDAETLVFVSSRDALGFFQPVPQQQLMNFTHGPSSAKDGALVNLDPSHASYLKDY
jgi:hypothetical protein